MIEAIDVVIPARNEEHLLGPALEAVLVARDALAAVAPRVDCRIVVVLDDCTDRSVAVAAEWQQRAAPRRDPRRHQSALDVLEVGFARVGRARAAGVEHLLDTTGPRPPSRWSRHFVCTTDADSRVPSTWLLDHLEAARRGALLTLGRVLPVAADLSAEALAAWHLAHRGTERHVFGANLGVRADAYLLAGGFPPLGTGEDEALVEAIENLGDLLPDTAARVVPLPHSVVLTSGRTDGRTSGGFAGYLRLLVDPGAPVAAD